MIEQPVCCATCKKLQRDTKYCHRRREIRADILKFTGCEYYDKKWREGWKKDRGY